MTYPDKSPRDEIAPALPWWRRVGAWITHMQKGVPVILSAIAFGTGVNVWIHGLVSRTELDQAVGAAVERAMVKALIDTNVELTKLKTNVGNLPEWRGDMSQWRAEIDTKLAVTTRTANHAESQIDSYFGYRMKTP